MNSAPDIIDPPAENASLTAQQQVDMIQRGLEAFPPADCPVVNRFTPGLYAREIFMPAGTAVVSRRHKTEHPFVVLSGRALVWTEETGVIELKAGQVGITKPGTRRVLYLPEDTRWITFHPTMTTDMDALQAELTETPDVSEIEMGPAEESILRHFRQLTVNSIDGGNV